MRAQPRIWNLFVALVLAGCTSIIESLGTTTGYAAITYVSTEKVAKANVLQGFREFVSQEEFSCNRPINSPTEILDSCTGRNGIELTMFEEPSGLKFLMQMHLMFVSEDRDKAKATIKATNAKLEEFMRTRFGSEVNPD